MSDPDGVQTSRWLAGQLAVRVHGEMAVLQMADIQRWTHRALTGGSA